MAKYKTETSKETIQQADKLAKANQRPGQTKEQTKLISQGIQKGIEQYKKQHKSKARELDKKLKNLKSKFAQPSDDTTDSIAESNRKPHTITKLPWALLVISWISFALYIYLLA